MNLDFELVLDLSPSIRHRERSPMAYARSDTLDDFIGECTVLNMESETGGDITGDDVINALISIQDELAAMRDKFGDDSFRPCRFLFKTRNNDGGEGRYLSQEAIIVLTQSGVKLVGIDMPSLSAKPHSGLQGFSYLVNLCLNYLEPGSHYRLLSPPLIAKSASPAPVRPVLVS